MRRTSQTPNDQEKGIIPKGLRGIDKEATWSKSQADGWVYGHGSFAIVSHENPFLGCFIWMPNSGNEAKRLWHETGHYNGRVDYVAMDSKADDYALFFELKRQRKMKLITHCRKHMDKTEKRREMIDFMNQPDHKKIYKLRSIRVEPMQALVKDIFELDRCWMRGNKNNQWLFAAMGLTIQMHQLSAFKEQKSTWAVKDQVLGQ